MMRKTSLLFLGALAGVLATLMITQPRALLVGSAARAAVSDTYRELNLFGDVFERVRADYVERPDDSKLVESAINGMLAGLDPHSSYMDPRASAICRCRPAASSAASASRSRWRTAW